MSPLKVGLNVLWVFCAASFFIATDSTAAGFGRTLFWVLLVVHAIEAVVVLPLLRKAPGELAGHVFQVMLYGFIHIQQVKEQVEGEAA